MNIIEVQFAPWDQIYFFSHPEKSDISKLRKGTFLIVKTSSGTEIGKVVGFKELNSQEVTDQEIRSYIRKATIDDLSLFKKNNSDNKEKMNSCYELIKKNNLNMKLVDCYSFCHHIFYLFSFSFIFK